MRLALLVGILCSAVATARESSAQIHLRETPAPVNVSTGAAWRSTGQPLFYAGAYFYRAGSTVFFDGHVMRQAGVDHGVVFYSDVTQEPFSIVYVPIGGRQMQPYERLREGDLAGTVGSRTPSHPVDLSIEVPNNAAMAALARDMDHARAEQMLRAHRPVGGMTPVASSQPPASAAAPPSSEFTAVGAVMIVPPNREDMRAGRLLDNADLPNAPGRTSVWVEYEGVRYYSAGSAVLPDASRFESAGALKGFAVYRERSGAADRIYVQATTGGLIAPYQRR